jgi:uncharacterized protein (DUF885 family)
MTDSGTASPAHAFGDRAWEQFLEANPVWATLQGDERWADRLDDPGPEGRERELAMIGEWEEEIARLDQGDLGVEDRITLHLIRVVIGLRHSAYAHRLWEMEAIDQYSGPQALPGDLARFQRLDGSEQVTALVHRLEAYPAWIEAHIASLEECRRRGRTAAAAVVDRVVTQTRRILATPVADAPLLAVAAAAGRPEGERQAIAAVLERQVVPAQARWLEYIERYRADARQGEGICWLPDGDELYRHHILAWTTLEEEPADIHAYGRERLAALAAEAAFVAAELGHPDVASVRAFLHADPSNYAAEGEALVRLAEEQIARTQDVAGQWFGHLPRAACEVRAVEPHMEQEAPPAFYVPPSADGRRPGVYYVNTYDPGSRHLHRLAATTFHEAVPGHHFQIAIEQELPTLPAFRRFGSRLAGGAYAEGWGLYAERLAAEMGLYADARERFGALESEAWRAARLVVDTGLHSLRWSRQQSIDFLREHAGLSPLEAETETDRYISWPGQALSYMIGQREILDLREQVGRRDGARFDLRAFHDAVLAHGSLPLSTLRAELPGWVAPAPD